MPNKRIILKLLVRDDNIHFPFLRQIRPTMPLSLCTGRVFSFTSFQLNSFLENCRNTQIICKKKFVTLYFRAIMSHHISTCYGLVAYTRRSSCEYYKSLLYLCYCHALIDNYLYHIYIYKCYKYTSLTIGTYGVVVMIFSLR